MNNFVFHNPVKVIFGKNVITHLGSELKPYGNKALLVYGNHSIMNNGVYSQVIHQLQKADIDYIELPGVRANPTLSHVQQGIRISREYQCSVIIGVGGGSVIDTAKSISAGMMVEFDIWKLFTGKRSITETMPVIAVPTIAGSGSETNNGIVLTHDEKKLKFGFGHRKLFPSVCLADPLTTFSVPAGLTVCGAVDTFTHCLEAYLSTSHFNSELQIGLIENICKTVLTSCSSVLNDPESYDNRAALLWGSSLALNGVATSGLGKISFPIHLLAHSLSAQHTISHGAALAVFMPGWLRTKYDSIKNRLARLGESVFNLSGGSSDYKAKRAIELIEKWLLTHGCSIRLADLGVSSINEAELVNHCLLQGKIWRMFEYDKAALEAVIRRCQSA